MSEWNLLSYAMQRLGKNRAKIPDFLKEDMYEKALASYQEEFGEIPNISDCEYNKEDWIFLFNECVRLNQSIEKFIKQFEMDGIPF